MWLVLGMPRDEVFYGDKQYERGDEDCTGDGYIVWMSTGKL